MSRLNRNETTEAFAERARLEQAAEDKAATTPGDLTEEDIKNLSPSTVNRIVNDRGLPQLGITAPRRRAR